MRFVSLLGKLLLLVLFFTYPVQGKAKTIVLVPGYFGSALPSDFTSGWKTPYFSQDIIRLYERAGYRVFVVNNLNSVGSIEENGKHVVDFLTAVKAQLEPGESLQVIAHSAGALYTLYATDHVEIPIHKMLTLSTPFEGLEFIDHLTEDLPALPELEKVFHLASLNQLRPQYVADFLKSLKAAPGYPIISYTGGAPRRLQFWDAANLSPEFYLTEEFMNEASDGIVTARSATSRAGLMGESPGDEYIHLDHWKQVMDADFFILMGMTDTGFIRKEQIRFYSQLLKKLD